MGAKHSEEAGLAVEEIMAAAPDHSKNRRNDAGHTVVQFSFGKEARRHIKELKLWEQRSENVELELVGRR